MRSSWSGMRLLAREEGVTSLWRYARAAGLRSGLGAAPVWTLHEWLRGQLELRPLIDRHAGVQDRKDYDSPEGLQRAVESARLGSDQRREVTRRLGVGAAAGAVFVLWRHPISIAKDLLGADISRARGQRERRQLRGLVHALAAIFKNRGVLGVYRYSMSSFVGAAMSQGLFLGGYHVLRDLYYPRASFSDKLMCAYACSLTSVLTMSPLVALESFHRPSRINLRPDEFAQATMALKHVMDQWGTLSVFRGVVLRSVAVCLPSAVALASYDTLRELYTESIVQGD